MSWLDRLAAGVLAPLAIWVLVSGLDDFFLDLCSLYFWFTDHASRRRPRAGCAPVALELGAANPLPEKKIALLIPAWREDAVIERMLDHNLAAIRYSNYEVFVGVYPNDLATHARVLASQKKHARVHHCICPHDGPTSKADCLNWLYEGLQSLEEKIGSHFEIILHHDAEDLIHPDSLRWINEYSERYDMVQVPVLPIPTPFWEFTHGTYCDEFAQSHLRDLHVRQRLGGFLPSCGVGTAYRRAALDRLAWSQAGKLFDPSSLTEDYRVGLDLHRLGCSQILLDARRLAGGRELGATREYFPRQFAQAVRQRTRWITGIALQSWQAIGWKAGRGQTYRLLRDRKGLAGNPLTIVANLIFFYGLGRWVWSQAAGVPWELAQMAPAGRWLRWVLAVNTAMIFFRLAMRASSVQPAFGWRHAAISPLRSLWGNLINFCATMGALRQFVGAWLRSQAPRWAKTDHSYPVSHEMPKRRLGEILVGMRLLGAAQLEAALENLGPGERLGERLLRQNLVTESVLYTALSAQKNLPFEPVEPAMLARDALECLPRELARQTQMIPVRITPDKRLWLAGPEAPSDETAQRLRQASRLKPEFLLITGSNYRALCAQLDGPS